MQGDTADLGSRIRSALPARWFPDATPVLDSLLAGFATGWTWVFDAIQYVRRQSRIATANGVWLDLSARDYFGLAFSRRAGQPDEDFRRLLKAELIRERGTRHAVESVLQDLTGKTPIVFEPANPRDTGGYGSISITPCGLAYGLAGGWGNLALPYQAFVTAFRPVGGGIGSLSGWGSAGAGYSVGGTAYASFAMITGSISDSDISAAVARVLPTATVAWLRITETK